MRVGIVCEFATLNGGERSLLSVLESWRVVGESEIDPVVIGPSSGPLPLELARCGVKRIDFDVRGPNGMVLPRPQLLDSLQALTERHEIDFLHANSLSMGKLTGLLAPRLRIPTTAHLRDIVGLSAAEVAALNANAGLVAVSEATRRHHLSQGLSPDRTVTIWNGVDLQRFRPRPRSGEWRRTLGLSGSAFLTATIGQIGLRKGQTTLAAAAATFLHASPRTHCLIIGERYSQKAESKAYETRIQETFEQSGFADRVHFLGYVSDLENLLPEVDLLIHPARQEPLGRVLLEAAASGVAIVATRVGGTEEIFDSHSAVLIGPDNPQELATAVVRLLNDDALRARIGASARARAVAHFDVKQSAARLAEFWRTLANGRKSRGEA